MTNTDLQQFWRQTLADWQASGLTGAAYCKQQSLVYHRFVYWRQKLNKPDHQDDTRTPAGFARVAPVPEHRLAEQLTLSFPNGITVTGLHADNIALLATLLRQL
ncbi:hypothetical protein HNR62_003216 [Oceanisphaera litoralis]|uniref:IS66 family insertion sequence element accessory protein TnpA n=1 Tax=Oceanisphaera litoralis TaxID=225144 RepID=UPI00195D6ADA|nr:IS66 family insertion sequence element accessory protein TnpB [Oceanisphaera litoralis]MBM7457304.1 hypothetical protein [Oceanisphaera litoralis]